jgi:hypothetical protein
MATEVPNNPAIARLARRQHAIATRDQLLAAGVTPGQLKGELARARWQRLNDARLGNKLVLRYASVLIYTDNADAVRQIRTALG